MRKDIPNKKRAVKLDLSINPSCAIIKEKIEGKVNVRLNNQTCVLLTKEKNNPEYLLRLSQKLNIKIKDTFSLR